MSRKYSQLENEGDLIVVFDRDQPMFTPGTTVTGRVIFNNSVRRNHVLCIRVKIRGKALVVITRTTNAGQGTAHTETYRAKKYFIKEEIVLCDYEALGRVLEPGTYEYPFHFDIPPECPPTFAYGGELAKVLYYVKAKVEDDKSLLQKMKGLRFDTRRNKLKNKRFGVFIVGTTIDLDARGGAFGEPVEAGKKTKAGGLMGLVGGRPVYCTARV